MTSELKLDLTSFGYADGGYMSKCSRCKETFLGAKRAWSCKPCALKKILEPKITRAVPDVAELVRYRPVFDLTHLAAFMDNSKNGEYVTHSEIEKIVAHLTKRLKATESAMDKVIDEKIEATIRAEAAEADRNHWKANHDNMAQRNAVLSQRPDLPVDRLPAIREYERMLAAKDVEIEKLKDQNDKFKWQVRDTCTRAEAAEAKLGYLEAFEKDLCAMLGVKNDDEALRSVEALLVKLAQIKAQKPVAFIEAYENEWFVHDKDGRSGQNAYKSILNSFINGRVLPEITPLFAAPVSDSLKAKCDRYEQALVRISKMDRSHGSWDTIAYDATNIACAALNVKTSV